MLDAVNDNSPSTPTDSDIIDFNESIGLPYGIIITADISDCVNLDIRYGTPLILNNICNGIFDLISGYHVLIR
jgi:hypothetical protein